MQRVLVCLLLSHAFLVSRIGNVESKSFLHLLSPSIKTPAPKAARNRSRRYSAVCPVLITSQTGYNLAMDAGGKVFGTRSPSHQLAHFERLAVDMGIVLLRHSATGRYLSIDNRGKLVSTEEVGEQVEFLEEQAANGFFVYLSRHHLPRGQWYIGINRKGRPINNSPRRPRKHTSSKVGATGRLRHGHMFIVRQALPCGWPGGNSWSRDT